MEREIENSNNKEISFIDDNKDKSTNNGKKKKESDKQKIKIVIKIEMRKNNIWKYTKSIIFNI